MAKFTSSFALAGILALAYVASAEPELATSSVAVETLPSANQFVHRGRFKFGGSAGYSKPSDGDSSIWISPSAEYFVNNQLSLGLETHFHFIQSQTRFRSLSPLVAYYFYKQDEIAVSFQQRVNFNSYRNPDYSEFDDTLITASSGFALDWFLNKYVALTPSIGMTYGNGPRHAYNGDIKLSVFY